MNYNYVQSEHIVVPAKTSIWGNIPYTGGDVLSVGLQNLGFQTGCYPTQLFAANANTVFYQIDNTNDQSVTILIYAVTNGSATAGTPWGTGTKSF